MRQINQRSRRIDQSPRIFSAALTMLIEGLAAQKVPNFLALATNTSVSMIASSESPLYQPSIQVSTILISSGLPSMNCLQVMVDRSSTTACAGADDSNSAAANKLALIVFKIISMGLCDVTS